MWYSCNKVERCSNFSVRLYEWMNLWMKYINDARYYYMYLPLSVVWPVSYITATCIKSQYVAGWYFWHVNWWVDDILTCQLVGGWYFDMSTCGWMIFWQVNWWVDDILTCQPVGGWYFDKSAGGWMIFWHVNWFLK
jgi:hypothetical protein